MLYHFDGLMLNAHALYTGGQDAKVWISRSGRPNLTQHY